MVTTAKIVERIKQSRWTKLYVASACFQGLTIIILQATIAYFNTAQINKGLQSDEIAGYPLTVTEAESISQAINRLGRIKWENIAFIGFQCWFVAMAFDATVYQNAAEVIALAVMNFACAVFGALEVIDGKKWLKILNEVRDKYNVPINTAPIRTAFYVEIVLSVMVGIFALWFLYLSFKVVIEFGWTNYKKIGADLAIQRMYQTSQFFVLALKIDIFIEFLVSVFYLIQFALDEEFNSWITYVFVVITILMLPMLYFGRIALASESYIKMGVFITFQLIVMFQLVLVADNAMGLDNHWYIWICFVILGMIVAVGTALLASKCMYNFGKGLKPFIQRGAEKIELMKQRDAEEQAGRWAIEDD
ncbi:hypothetical protein EDC94DRAFT_596445 [Helicostylum pulchrum]|uniref:Uncharacterized protein n=1 Tax=Helicostylum pulchrum TaxID=562976 RepID=A0ABP9XL58_9FUNG|nr:hypothetical protein EDC94DRAFT_596445 [Helicostylum pulchrum]